VMMRAHIICSPIYQQLDRCAEVAQPGGCQHGRKTRSSGRQC
jgi:UDP-N-acetylglucosamine enolpyruvyl transferase